jgi:hypothetical protein
VCGYLTLQEIDYFGLQYVNNNVKVCIRNTRNVFCLLDVNMLRVIYNRSEMQLIVGPVEPREQNSRGSGK